MSKTIALILVILTLIFIFYFFFYQPKLKTIEVKINDQVFTFEVATTPAQKSRGLMHRQNLCSTCGMLFIFNSTGTYPFWMKDTLIPLDIIWLDKDGMVVDLKTGQPQDVTLLTNQKPAKFVIETNPHATGLKIGDTVKL